ncbi:unnamed protein product [marine sediment metagenome]|uniref:Uncharacterized protein n=1 Tax=marine sediment metagenome TaxID=412755 RepID=X0UNG5_9ZZZZ
MAISSEKNTSVNNKLETGSESSTSPEKTKPSPDTKRDIIIAFKTSPLCFREVLTISFNVPEMFSFSMLLTG